MAYIVPMHVKPKFTYLLTYLDLSLWLISPNKAIIGEQLILQTVVYRLCVLVEQCSNGHKTGILYEVCRDSVCLAILVDVYKNNSQLINSYS